jgi:hypothetical protein
MPIPILLGAIYSICDPERSEAQPRNLRFARAANLLQDQHSGCPIQADPERSRMGRLEWDELRITKEHHKTLVHVILLMTVKKRQSRIVRRKLHVHLFAGGHEHRVFQNAVRFRHARKSA